MSAEIPDVIDSARIRELTLDNGLRVLLQPRGVAPTVDVRLAVPVDAADHDDRAALRVLAACLTDSRRRGGGPRPAAVLADQGALVEVTATGPMFQVSVSVLTEGLEPVLRLLGRALRDHDYLPEDAARATARVAASATTSLDRLDALERLLLGHRYGDHPVALSAPAPADLARVDVRALSAAHATWLVPDGAVLVVVGRFDDDVAETVRAALGPWAGVRTRRRVPPPAVVTPPDLLVVDSADGAGATAWTMLAGPAVGLEHPDHPALHIASALLAGHPGARLSRELRDDRQLAYTVVSGVMPGPAGNWHAIEYSCAPSAASGALEATARILGRLCGGDIGDDEIDAARRFSAAVPRLATANQAAVATAIASFAAAALPARLLTGFPERVRATSDGAVRRVIECYFRPERMHAAVELPAALPRPSRVACWEVIGA